VEHTLKRVPFLSPFVLSQVRNIELERQITVMVGRVANKVFPKYQQDDGVQDKQATWEEARVALNLNHRRVQSASSNCLSSFLSSLLNPRSSFSKRSFAKTGSGQCKKDWGKNGEKGDKQRPAGFRAGKPGVSRSGSWSSGIGPNR
jgi:hypothetical protein